MHTDEYENVYGSELIGFLFHCTKSGISQPISLSAKEMSSLPLTSCNEDDIYLHCKPCDEFMLYREGSGEGLSGYWVCPDCGRTVREVTPYRKLDKINRRFESEFCD